VRLLARHNETDSSKSFRRSKIFVFGHPRKTIPKPNTSLVVNIVVIILQSLLQKIVAAFFERISISDIYHNFNLNPWLTVSSNILKCPHGLDNVIITDSSVDEISLLFDTTPQSLGPRNVV
jgi:hypothetical protein